VGSKFHRRGGCAKRDDRLGGDFSMIIEKFAKYPSLWAFFSLGTPLSTLKHCCLSSEF
jgi:hypothetical protein